MKTREIGYDVARVYSMLYIVALFHPLGYVNILYHNTIVRSVVLMSLGTFTFITGLFASSNNQFETKEHIFSFYKKRFLRLYPLFALSALLMLCLKMNDFKTTMYGIFGVSALMEPHPRTLWYVVMLFYFTIITPIVVKNNKRNQIILSSIILLISMFIIYLLNSHSWNNTVYYLPTYLCGLYIGRYECSNFKTLLTTQKKSALFVAISVLLICVIVKINIYILEQILIPILGAYLILYFSFKISRFIRSKILLNLIRIIGYSSMAVYLFHREFYCVLLYLFSPTNAYIRLLYIIFFCFPISLIGSYYIQKLYDKIIGKNDLSKYSNR